MAENTEVQLPQNPAAVVTPTVTDSVTLSKKEHEDLVHRADVSSQNFERLKKVEEENLELKNAVAQLQDTTIPPDPESERVNKLENELSDVKAELGKRETLEKYPVLKDKWEDLEAFRQLPENAGMNLRTAAKAFLVEKGFLEPTRQGLEQGTGGPHAPIVNGMTPEEVGDLRKNNFKKYSEMIKKGQIQIRE